MRERDSERGEIEREREKGSTEWGTAGTESESAAPVPGRLRGAEAVRGGGVLRLRPRVQLRAETRAHARQTGPTKRKTKG